MQRSYPLVVATLVGALTTGAVHGGDAVDDAARAACHCMKPLFAQLAQLQAAMRSGDEAAMDRLEAEMDQSSEADECMERIAEEYPELRKDSAQQNQVRQRMQALCPAPAMPFGM